MEHEDGKVYLGENSYVLLSEVNMIEMYGKSHAIQSRHHVKITKLGFFCYGCGYNRTPMIFSVSK